MGRILETGGEKPVYYEPESLTVEEKSRYFYFTPALSENQLQVVKEWIKKHTTNFALVDEDYIFFTLKSEHDEFRNFWLEYNDIPEATEEVFQIGQNLAVA